MLHLLTISDSDKHFASAIQEYLKRLGTAIKITQLKPYKNGSHEQIMQQETSAVISILQKQSSDTLRVMLSIDGQSLDTSGFSRLITNRDVMFIIGGPYGLLEDQLKPYLTHRISFGQMTMPHGLAKLVLLEQIYRSTMITQGREYHY